MSDHMTLVMPTIWSNVLLRRHCLRSSGWPAVAPHRPWSASSDFCSSKLCRRVTPVKIVQTTSVIRGCCAADLNPWTVPRELSGGFAGAGQQQGATGLWVHQQLQQGRGRGPSKLNRALKPSPGSTVGGGQRAGDASSEQLRYSAICRDGRSIQLDGQSWPVLEHFAQMPKQSETGDVGAGVNALADRLVCSSSVCWLQAMVCSALSQISRLGSATHGPRKQHPGAQWATN